ncbi:MAG: GNAT family N-acetyltransferase, partial [Pseudomonadota bacterium]|nr:GNAT family N-acetyltransferase [Pseudomonadota bacterium]
MITAWSAHDMAQRLDDLAEILHACVTDGASVGFILPHTLAEAKTFWQGLLAEVEGGVRRLYVALDQGQPAGVVTLITAMPGNQPHRGEVSKLLVHPG